jgi:hypothetical protein
VEPEGFFTEAVLEMAKPDDVPAVPTAVTLHGFDSEFAVLRNFQNNGARTVSLDDWGKWELNGYVASPTLLRFWEADCGRRLQRSLPRAAELRRTHREHQHSGSAQAHGAQQLRRLDFRRHSFLRADQRPLHSTRVALDIRADILGKALQKRGPGKLVLAGDNEILLNIFVKEGELASRHARALGAHATVFDGAHALARKRLQFWLPHDSRPGISGTNGALATRDVALFSSNVVLSAPATINSATINATCTSRAPSAGPAP